jgi:hypothetical protein
MLLQLVAEMRRLGATIVAADFSSVIVATGKHSLAAAIGCAANDPLHYCPHAPVNSCPSSARLPGQPELCTCALLEAASFLL